MRHLFPFSLDPVGSFVRVVACITSSFALYRFIDYSSAFTVNLFFILLTAGPPFSVTPWPGHPSLTRTWWLSASGYVSRQWLGDLLRHSAGVGNPYHCRFGKPSPISFIPRPCNGLANRKGLILTKPNQTKAFTVRRTALTYLSL